MQDRRSTIQSRRAVLIGGAASLSLTLPAHGQAPAAANSREALIDAYPDYLKSADDDDIVWRDGTRMAWNNRPPGRSFEARLADSTLEDQMSIGYVCGPLTRPLAHNEDPGRLRNIAFFKKMYGAEEAAVRDNLVSVPWRIADYRGTLPFTRINGAHRIVAGIVEELAALPPRFAAFLVPPGGSFNWRPIAGTGGLSPHAFGIALDINVARSDYWRWNNGRGWTNRIPFEIVDIFERHRFIWGGKWSHYDTMHFEYRPELIAGKI